MNKQIITSSSNMKIKQLVQLQKKARVRKQQKTFVIEGIRIFTEVPDELRICCFVTESFWKSCDTPLKEKIKSGDYEIVTDKLFKEAAETQTPQGIMATVRWPEYQLEDLQKGESPFLLILENIQDPGNMGTIMRTAEGAGVDGIIITNASVDLFNPKVVRSTMGSVFRVPFIYVDELTSIIQNLTAKGTSVFAAHLNGSRYYYEADYKKSTAFIIGNEGNGITPETAKLATDWIQIPMSGQLESLNASVAAAILMYEAKKQRSVRKS